MGYTNRYNFKVVDAQNNPVPFANVMNTRDNVGTYTDIRGNFNLVSTDSVMDVQIRSQGFLSNNYRLMPSAQTGSLVLKEDENARRMITQQSSRLLVTSVTRKDSTEIEEPEDGWGNYNTYVQNNIQIPDNIRSKKTSTDVELSFDIDKNGQPVNIKVTKSSQCKECDEEAKRLLREGPKWKRKGKKSKTTISIAIDK
jgi:TonB family protein